MRDLLAAVARMGVEVAVGNPVSGLVVEDDRVVGVRVDGPRSGSYELRSAAVVLAANGFGNNAALVQRWIPDIVGAQYFGAEGSTGEAIGWCLDRGVALGNMGAYQGYAAVAYPHGSIVSWTTVEMGGVLLAPDGRRMGDETIGYSGFAPVVAAHAQESFVVLDRRIRDYVASHEPEFAELIAIGGGVEVADERQVAARIGAAEDTVRATLRQYRAAAAGESPDVHDRRDFGMAPLESPYVVIRSIPAIFHTQGGVRVDDRARVLREDGSVVEGLLAGGGVTTGVSGAEGATGYSSGNGLLSAIGLGQVAGREAAARSGIASVG